MHDEPIMDVAHLAHLEILTPKPEESLRFFVDVLGHDRERPPGRLGLPARLGRLRALLPATDRLEDIGPRPRGLPRPQPAGPPAARAGAAGLRLRGRLARGRIGPRPCLQVPRSGRAPDRALLRDGVVRGAARTPPLPEEPGAALPGARRLRPASGPRQLLGPGRTAEQGNFVRDVLGGRVTEQIQLDDGSDLRAVAALHQQGLRPGVHARGAGPGRAGACTMSRSRRTRARTSSGPPTSAWTTGFSSRPDRAKHAIQQTFFLYVYEPGGNRIELCNPGRPAGAGAGLAHDHLDRGSNGPRARPGA